MGKDNVAVKEEDTEGDAKNKENKENKDKPGSPGKVQRDITELDQRKLFKEGQRNMTPPVADPTRGFYESLLGENPDSKIAIKFCVEFGVFPLEQHTKLLKKYNHLKDKGAFSVAAQIKRALTKKEKSSGKDKDKLKIKK